MRLSRLFPFFRWRLLYAIRGDRMIRIHQNIRGGGCAAGVHRNPQRSNHREGSTWSRPYRMEWQVVGRGDSIVRLVRLEVQAIRAVVRSVVEHYVDRGLGIVLLIIHGGGAR